MQNLVDFCSQYFDIVMFIVAITALITCVGYQKKEVGILQNKVNENTALNDGAVGEFENSSPYGDESVMSREEVKVFLMTKPKSIVYIDNAPFDMRKFSVNDFNYSIVSSDYYKKVSELDNNGKLLSIKFYTVY